MGYYIILYNNIIYIIFPPLLLFPPTFFLGKKNGRPLWGLCRVYLPWLGLVLLFSGSLASRPSLYYCYFDKSVHSDGGWWSAGESPGQTSRFVPVWLNIFHFISLCFERRSIDGVVLCLFHELGAAVLKSLPFLGMTPCVDGDQGLQWGFSGHPFMLE